MTTGDSPPLSTCSYVMAGSLETVQELIRGVKARTEEEMENWGPGRIRIRASTDPSEPNIFMDDRKEAEKWEHLDIVNNRLGTASPLDEACGGSPVRHRQQRAWSGLLRKCLWTLAI